MTLRQVKAAVLLIGDELLSGRTQDINLRAIAKFLAPLGVQVAEALGGSADDKAVAAAVTDRRALYAYVSPTGGTAPPQDKKPADAIAAAFGVHIGVRDDARAILEAHYKDRASLNESRLRMARIPDGASLIANPVSKAPGFQIGNVFVMAGGPPTRRGKTYDLGHPGAGAAGFWGSAKPPPNRISKRICG